jgi:hypothetical protein
VYLTPFDRAAVASVIAAMEHYDNAWHNELADYLTIDGDIDQRRQGEYERAKDDHAWPVLDNLTDWINLLRAALAAAAPETAPESTP